MYYIVAYDITSPKRLPKVLKLCRRYLNWVQNSVFEGELTTAQFDRLKKEMQSMVDKKEDSVIYYCARTPEVVERGILGVEKNEITNFI
ncbi:MAG: CRISPR-associated endonuclease Cas2 [Ignavibacteriaceae bacterium]|nr:CRISPR-associated endonuclease Cas2 [Ignavibacteriaceae bacterium]